jgi:two-component system phosphate regulon response regulator PhoB
MNNTILVVDDEPDVMQLVTASLKGAGYQVLCADDGAECLAKARSAKPELIVLDVMLPEMSGLEICKVLKNDAATSAIPVILLTAKGEEIDRVVGLELGADDYVTKPFSPRELVLRVKSVLRRAATAQQKPVVTKIGTITVDRERCEVRLKGKMLELTPTEFKLLSILSERRGLVHSREKLLNEVWGYETAIESRTVDTHVRRLRDKLGNAADCIETVRGFGYRIVEEVR